MMVLDVSRSHIKVNLNGKIATLPGEMFFPKNGKLGFALFLSQIENWDEPSNTPISKEELDAIVSDMQNEFAKGGHTLVLE